MESNGVNGDGYVNKAYDQSTGNGESAATGNGVLDPDLKNVNLELSDGRLEADPERVEGLLVRKVYLENAPLRFRIARIIKKAGRIITQISYEIEVEHGGYRWSVIRDFQHIHALYFNLYFHQMSLTSNGNERGRRKSKPEFDFPSFPSKWQPKMSEEEEALHITEMESFLSNILNIPVLREHLSARRFLEVSWLSFDPRLTDQEKFREALVNKLSCNLTGCCLIPCGHNNITCKMLAIWKQRWVVLHETCYIYLHLESAKVAGVFLYNQRMKLEHLSSRPASLLVKHSVKDLVLRFPSPNSKQIFSSQFETVLDKCEFTKDQPHDSFAPVREETRVKWLVNGEDYMSSVADALEMAKEEIFIGGWWVSPDVHLKRPGRVDKYWRLDHILHRKAEAGVLVHILMYKESPIAFGINSWYTKNKLKNLHPNIMVKRHPDKNVLLWSHHEKMVIVDQRVAFVGGIDICYGRWDNHLYKLNDIGKNFPNRPNMNRSLSTGSKGDKKKQQGRALGREMKEEKHHRMHLAEYLIAPFRNLRIRMNHPKFQAHSKMRSRMKHFRHRVHMKGHGAMNKLRRKSVKGVENGDAHEAEYMEEYTWLGKDYCNEVKKAFVQPNSGATYDDILDRTEIPRLPWHDAGAVVFGRAARDVARHFIQKWNACKMQKFRFDDDSPFIIPKLYSILDQEVYPEVAQSAMSCSVQFLRNTASWSAGLLPDHVETSVQQGYIDLIDNSKHYVYLESQFFITLVKDDDIVKNQVGNAIFRRIEKAHKNGETFRFYIVIPLQPAIAGTYGTRAGAAVQAVTHWIYQSISRGGNSLMQKLIDAGVDPSQYLTISGLRTHGIIEDRLVTEIVYVHSKLMIVDDVYTIIGSANMNDRSMLGERDSEMAILITDTTFEPSLMNGQPYQAGVFSASLRRRLMKINLGLMEDMLYGLPAEKGDDIVRDPISVEFYRNVYIKTAVENENIFQEVFGCVPNDKVFTFHELEEYSKKETIATSDPQQAHQMLQRVHGYLSKFPLKFLKDSNLLPSFTTSPGLLPVINWT